MKGLISILKARWFVTLIGAIVLSLLVWFLGPLIAVADVRPLESDLARFVCVVVILVVWGLTSLYGVMKAKKTDEALAADLSQATAADDGSTADAAMSAEEVAILNDRLREALGLLKQAKLGRGRQYLYQLPWYVLIGPPGSGKTTALVNSGLSFPLADKLGRDAVRGVGGTRNCDWWFTDEAVLLDTAGRYTTQDSHRAVDSAAWTGFLSLLKKHRPRQPINGTLVAISLSDLATLTEAERLTHAREIRKRLRELHDTLGVRFPTYVLFTKADLIAGFVEFFDDLGREEREQVWGMTLPFDDGSTTEGAVATVGAEFDALVQRLNQRLVERVHQEPDVQRRSLIFGFPSQVASLKEAAQSFLTEIFQPSRLEERPLLRGVYLTSGTQEGTPVDRLMGAMASTFGVERQRMTAFSGTGRSYFLTRFLKDVVFTEASIVSANRKVEQRNRWIQRGAIAAALLLTIGMAAAWGVSFVGNRGLIATTDQQVANYHEQLGDLDVSRVADGDILKVVPALDTLRGLPGGYDDRDEPVPASLGLGLYQGDKLGPQGETAYRRALNA
ncbi:MAG TPA: type VI secretion system membrane subunit TssM, partial [Alphaproteobacteria bacterium]|nr:type VI secretion system membrane subunit TssM [Alphaproteobacteria bacterium]